jgi:transposase
LPRCGTSVSAPRPSGGASCWTNSNCKLEEIEAAAAEDDAAVEASTPPDATGPAPTRRKPVRAPFPAHLPRERVVIPGPATCPCCNGKLAKLGEDVTETLEVIPRQWKVIQIVRERFTCRACETISQVPAPFHVIPRGRAGPELLAMILEAKFGQHLPLNRQSETYAREGIDLDVSTLADWVGACTATLAPLVALIRDHMLAAERIHGDDTTVPVLAKTRTTTGRLWTYVRDDRPAGFTTPPAVWFAYSEDRKGEHPQRHLKDFKGALQADAYAGLHHLYGSGTIYEVSCWAHARRKFHDIHVVHASPTTTEAIARIGALYGIEEQIRGKPVDIRRAVRQDRARPLLDDLHHWMEKTLASLSTKSETAGAIRYALSRWRALTRYVDDGLLEIDNNAAERSLRSVVMGRKNYLFLGSDSGGQRAASLYSLIATAKLNGIDPAFYLRTVLARIPEHPINRIEELLAWNVAASLRTDSSQAA